MPESAGPRSPSGSTTWHCLLCSRSVRRRRSRRVGSAVGGAVGGAGPRAGRVAAAAWPNAEPPAAPPTAGVEPIRHSDTGPTSNTPARSPARPPAVGSPAEQAEQYRSWIANRRALDQITAAMDELSHQAVRLLTSPPLTALRAAEGEAPNQLSEVRNVRLNALMAAISSG